MYKTALFLVMTTGALSAATVESGSIPFLSKPLHAKTSGMSPSSKAPIGSASTTITKSPPPCTSCKDKKETPPPASTCYSPSSCQIGRGFSLSGSYLLWKASENLSPFAQVVTKENIIDASRAIGSPRGHNQSTNPEWASGFNIRFGYRTDYDCWDLFADWTWYRNRTHNSITSPTDSSSAVNNPLSGTQNGLGIYNSWGKTWASANATDVFSGLPTQLLPAGPFANASVHWKLDYNTINLEFGRSFKSKTNLLRPFFGLQGAMFERTISAAYTGYANQGSLATPSGITAQQTPKYILTGFQSAYSEAKMNFWGIGPMLGVIDYFRLGYGFSLFGQLGTSLLYGRTHGYDQNSLIETLSNGTAATYDGVKWESHTLWSFAAHMQARFGAGWSFCFNKQKSKFFLSAAWEENFWFLTNYSSAYNTGNMNFSLGGLKATAGFNF